MSKVMGVYSRKARGFAVPVDLLRVVCRVANRCAVRGRVAAEFAGYLVTEPGPVARAVDCEAGYPFRNSRAKYAGRRVGVAGTGFPLPSEFGGDIDAPEWLLCGAMFWCDGVGPFPVARARGES